MITWPVKNTFIYVSLSVNSLSTQGRIACPLKHLILTSETAKAMEILCRQTELPIVFDFFGINISDSRAFEIFRDVTFLHPVVFLNVNNVCESRLRDDGVVLSEFQRSGCQAHFWVGNNQTNELPGKLDALKEDFFRSYVSVRTDALTDWDKTLPSTPVHATKYYDVKKLCVQKTTLQVIATGLAIAILQQELKFDIVVSSSYTGAFIAVPVSILVGKPLHCWTDLGPSFRPQRRMEWAASKEKKCLLVSDVICMGTEVRATQAFLTALGCQLVACAAVATYFMPTSSVPFVSLLKRDDLEEMGYFLKISERETINAIK